MKEDMNIQQALVLRHPILPLWVTGMTIPPMEIKDNLWMTQ
jgi:hypothetical protein